MKKRCMVTLKDSLRMNVFSHFQLIVGSVLRCLFGVMNASRAVQDWSGWCLSTVHAKQSRAGSVGNSGVIDGCYGQTCLPTCSLCSGPKLGKKGASTLTACVLAQTHTQTHTLCLSPPPPHPTHRFQSV